jgi:LuxR family maltose regulon positive regulatory protein
VLGEAHLLAGHVDEAGSVFTEASTAAVLMGNSETSVLCDSHLALLAIDRGDWQEAAGRLERALTAIDEYRMHDYVSCLLAFAGAARLALHRGDLSGTRRQLARAMRARPSATYLWPHHAVRLRLQLARVYHALADAATARQLLLEIDDILIHRPALGALVDEVKAFRTVLASGATSGATSRPALTSAELRLLPYLQTHLTAAGIADRLFLSTHTVKGEFKSIYRKLGVSTRRDAVQKATAIGLLGG